MNLYTAQLGPRNDATARAAGAARERRATGLRRRGFTLGELAISLGIVSLLLLAMGSVMVVSGRAVGVSATHAGEAKVDDAVATLASEHRLALEILERTTSALRFTVPDRDGDAQAEIIRYAWDSTSKTLTRQYNTETPVTVVRDVQNFHLRYLDKPGGPAPAPELESEEVLLMAHTGANTTGGTTPNAAMSATAWYAQYFKPTFPADREVKSWQVTRVNIRLGKASTVPSTSTQYYNFQIRAANDSKQPTGAAVGGDVVRRDVGPMTATASSATPPWLLSAIPFTKVTGLDPSKGACLVVNQPLTSLGTTGYIGTQSNATPMTPDTHYMSGTGGLSWTTEQQTRDMYIQVYGKYRYVQK